VLEEAGVEIDPLTLCSIEMFGSLSWYRMVYTARSTGNHLCFILYNIDFYVLFSFNVLCTK